jgi:hypothetical protein
MYILKSNEFAILIYSLKTLEIWTYDPIRNNFQEYSLIFFIDVYRRETDVKPKIFS